MVVQDYYEKNGSDFPWRKTKDPYKILISEIMLQQTQVNRVVSKFQTFITKFPSFSDLSDASLEQVLQMWQGLGYNRRAIYLKRTADIVTNEYNGKLPNDPRSLKELPGIGDATSASIMAFAFNKPVNLIETNIRSLYIYFFLRKKQNISDYDILPFIEKTLDNENPRKWYNALMDYGRMIKKKFGNLGRKSKKYSKQKPFKGSNRQIRGIILRSLLKNNSQSEKDLIDMLNIDIKKLKKILSDLEKEGFIIKKNQIYEIVE
ncbi:MAG: A/G-specific adenine glycosylase [Candidatus Lokiarchaeota archaeon]|nr:A/G-specific adenine glycosylase [Candidatus Lokiarchaeota archaeon]